MQIRGGGKRINVEKENVQLCVCVRSKNQKRSRKVAWGCKRERKREDTRQGQWLTARLVSRRTDESFADILITLYISPPKHWVEENREKSRTGPMYILYIQHAHAHAHNHPLSLSSPWLPFYLTFPFIHPFSSFSAFFSPPPARSLSTDYLILCRRALKAEWNISDSDRSPDFRCPSN